MIATSVGPAWRGRALDRLAPQAIEEAAPVAVSPAFAWCWLVRRIGRAIPAPVRDLPQLKRRLVRAGFRDPSAARMFQAGRAGLAALFGLVGLAVVWKIRVNVLVVPALAM